MNTTATHRTRSPADLVSGASSCHKSVLTTNDAVVIIESAGLQHGITRSVRVL